MKYIKNGKIATNSIELNGFTIINPTHDQYIEAGYEEYIQPEPEPYIPTEEDLIRQYEQKVVQCIREKYTEDQEIALLRRKLANDETINEQFDIYNAYCEECKARVKSGN